MSEKSAAIEKQAASSTGKGIACMVAAGFMVSLQDAVTKWLTGGYPVGEVIFIRSLFVYLPVVLFVWREGGVRCLKTRRPGAQVLCCLFTVIATGLFVLSLSLLPLAEATAATFTGPIFVTALAFPLLGERVGRHRWSAVVIGFAGVLLMLRPTGAAVQWAILIPVCAAFSGALRDIVTRRLTIDESTIAILFYSNLAITVLALFTLPFGWRLPTAGDTALFAAAGFLLGIAYYLWIQAFRFSEVTVVMPFKYTMVIWAAALGYLVWGDLPDRFVIAGAALVVASGLYILHRETSQRSRRPGEGVM